MEPLEHLVHEDPEPLVDGRLLGDPEHPRELVLQRAGPVGVDVRRREHDAVAALGQERRERGLVAGGDRLGAPTLVALGVEQVVVERRGREDLALLRGDRLEQARVHVAQRLGQALALGPGDQRRDLQQLQIPDDGVGDVEVGVEPQLAQAAAGAHRALQQLVAKQPVGRVERLGRPEQLLVLVLPFAPDRLPGRVGQRRRREHGAPVVDARVAEHRARAGAGEGRIQRPADREPPDLIVLGGDLRREQRVRDPLGHGHGQPAVEPHDIHVIGLQRERAPERDDLDGAGLRLLGLVLLAQAGVGYRRDRAGELAGRRLGRSPGVRGGQLAESRQRPQSLDHVGLGGEQLVPAQSQPVDQPVHVQVGAGGVDRGDPRAVELQEDHDPLAGLGRNLRRLRGSGERRDHVELPPPRDLGAPGDVDRPQLDRGTRQRTHHRGRVRRVRQQPQPREQVADLRALEERSLADHSVRHGPLLERHGHRLALTGDRRHEHEHVARGDPRS